MDMNQPPPGKAPDLTDLDGKVSVGLVGRRPWLWRFLGICLLAAVIGGPASLAGGLHQETTPSAKVQNAWLTASVSVVDTITFVPVAVANQIVGATVTVSASSSLRLRDGHAPVEHPIGVHGGGFHQAARLDGGAGHHHSGRPVHDHGLRQLLRRPGDAVVPSPGRADDHVRTAA